MYACVRIEGANVCNVPSLLPYTQQVLKKLYGTLKYHTCPDDAQCFFFQQQVLKGPSVFALLVHFCPRVIDFTWLTLSGFQRLVSEPQPPVCILLSRFFLFTSSVIWHFFTSTVPANISPGPLSGPKLIEDLNQMTPPQCPQLALL